MRKNARKGIPAQSGRNIPRVLRELRRAWEIRKAVTQYLLAEAEFPYKQKKQTGKRDSA
ncbi:MAG TPA: hypothetical protein PLL10_02665 [Elusimicrobiales bacterium]|jgi:hypothetical protein|nr:hypothetical protein [Elusimicrobiales bacterium]